MSSTNILKNKFEHLCACITDAGQDPRTWILNQLGPGRGPMDAAETESKCKCAGCCKMTQPGRSMDALDLMNSEIRKRGCSHDSHKNEK